MVQHGDDVAPDGCVLGKLAQSAGVRAHGHAGADDVRALLIARLQKRLALWSLPLHLLAAERNSLLLTLNCTIGASFAPLG